MVPLLSQQLLINISLVGATEMLICRQNQ